MHEQEKHRACIYKQLQHGNSFKHLDAIALQDQGNLQTDINSWANIVKIHTCIHYFLTLVKHACT